MLLHRSIRKCTPHLQLSPTTNPSLLNKTEQFWWYWRVTMAQSTYFTVHYIFWLNIVHYILEKLLYTGTVWRYLPFVIPTIPGVLIGDRQLSCLWQWWNHWGFVLPCFWLQPFMLDWTSGHRSMEWSEFSMVNHISHSDVRKENIWQDPNFSRYGPGYKDPFNFQARLPNLYRVPAPTPTDQWDSIWQSIPYLGVDIPPQARTKCRSTWTF